jgi:hypothetical protein
MLSSCFFPYWSYSYPVSKPAQLLSKLKIYFFSRVLWETINWNCLLLRVHTRIYFILSSHFLFYNTLSLPHMKLVRYVINQITFVDVNSQSRVRRKI